MNEMFDIQIEEKVVPDDKFPYHLVLKITFTEKAFKERLINKYLDNMDEKMERHGHSGFILNYSPFCYVGGIPFSDNSYLDIYKAMTDDGVVIRFRKPKQSIDFYGKGIKHLNKFLIKEEHELVRILTDQSLM